MASAAPTLRVTDLVAGYVPGHPVLRGVNLTAEPGRITVVLGPNGAGKSTLLKAITGFLTPESGAVLLGGSEIGRVAPHRRISQGIGLLPQGRSVFPDLTVVENIELGGWTIREERARLRGAVEAMLNRYPHLRPLRHRPAGSLSGGQQRAVELARMLVSNPSVLLIDEPSVGLSPIVASQVYQELVAFKAEGRTVLLVDQDVRAAIRTADYVYVLSSGRNDVEGDRAAFEGDLGAMVRGWLGVGESTGGAH
ncbi:MAG TPA: ABC transporter ATP-binding protein [Hyphomicrobiaceae bacterium]|jgi:branched-chain amino acid transport system ATP-binding protein|nr:ABC transporter ATP-binding protein [Hyphomicrobiaceae bacterium]